MQVNYWIYLTPYSKNVHRYDKILKDRNNTDSLLMINMKQKIFNHSSSM